MGAPHGWRTRHHGGSAPEVVLHLTPAAAREVAGYLARMWSTMAYALRVEADAAEAAPRDAPGDVPEPGAGEGRRAGGTA